MKSFWDHIKEEKRPVVIYGTGNAAEKLFFLLKERGIRTMAFSSSSSFLRDRSFLGYKVLPLERIREIYGSDIVLLLGFGSHDESVIEHIVGLSKEYDLSTNFLSTANWCKHWKERLLESLFKQEERCSAARKRSCSTGSAKTTS